jgi:hypothetical protein
LPLLLGNPAAEERPLTFEQHVRPILKTHCFHCHGEEEKHEGKLDVRLARLLRQGGETGPAIAPGKAGESLLLQRVVDGEMPPEGKKVSAEEIAVLRKWIDQGAKTARPEPAELSDITDEERAFWSFQPIKNPPLPGVVAQGLGRDGAATYGSEPIDAFLLEKLATHQLGFSPPAEPAQLVRRLWYDLIGLPPPPEEADAFLADHSPDAAERLTDRLLAMPQYGERWGRHWLDVAGYADSDGYTERDLPRKYAYKYRDYVIRSFNADTPWDQFLMAQLAGDELLARPFADLSPAQADLLVATGFLRMAPDGTGDGGIDQPLARNDVLAETLKIVSSSLLGLTVGCAQCHNHRYDPIPQVDYYRLRAVFEPALDPKNWRAPGSRLVSLWSNETRQQVAAVDADLKTLTAERTAEMEKIVADIFEKEVAKLPEEKRDLAKKARETADKDRTPEQKQLLKEQPSLKVDSRSAYLYDRKRVDDFNKQYDARQAELQARRPAEDFVACLTEMPGQIPQTFVFSRGDINQPRQQVEPADLEVLSGQPPIAVDDPALPTTGRRLALGKWLTSGQHPLTARVLVNRFWMHHFGRGIVATPADFGRLGAPPTHPELLDWLATRFMQDGWELKKLHRLLLHSAAYRQNSRRTDALDQVDPENHLLGRMPLQRLEAEAVRDSLLAASGSLIARQYGPPSPVTVDDVGQVIVGIDNRDTAGRPTGKRAVLGADEFRRSVYVQVRRSQRLSMLEAFDAPALSPNCEIRTRSTVAPAIAAADEQRICAHAVPAFGGTGHCGCW